MNDSSTYQAVRIGDIADWRLICGISSRGMNAYLKHSDPTREIVTMFDDTWQSDESSLLQSIENCVYDHPQVLDDFTADVVVTAPKSIWVPTELVADDEDETARLYSQVYQAEEFDVMQESIGEATCLYSLVPGLNAFLQRTFPGARIHSHLAVMASRFRERSSDVPRVYVEIRENEADFLAFDRKNLLMGATHYWRDIADIQYHLFNILNVYNLNPKDVQISLSGLRDVKNQLMAELRKNISYVMLTMMPSIGAKAGMPLPEALLLGVKDFGSKS